MLVHMRKSYVDHEAKGDVLTSYEVAQKAKKELKKAWVALVKAERSALAAHGLSWIWQSKR